MILRGILNILTATLGDNTPDFLSVNTVNNYSSLIIEGIPVIMLRKNKKNQSTLTYETTYKSYYSDHNDF